MDENEWRVEVHADWERESKLCLRPHRKIRMIGELPPRVFAGKAPIDARVPLVRPAIPGAHGRLQGRKRGNALRPETLARDQAEFDLGLIEPTPVRRRAIHRHAPPESPGEMSAEVFPQR